MNWNYKIELKTESVFGRIEELRNIKISENVRKFISENNAASPEKYHYMLGTDEKIFGAVLSFNENELDVDSVFTALQVVEDMNLLPIAIDPFGNYLCLNVEKDIMVYWNHENDGVTELGLNLVQLVEKLY